MKKIKKKYVIITIILFVCITASILGYCFVYDKYSKISFRLTVNDEVITSCDNAYITDLSPKPHGGYRVHCGNGTSVYIVYGTIKGKPTEGTIDHIRTLNYMDSLNNEWYYPTQYDTDALSDCPSAKGLERTTGGSPLPTTFFGDIRKGTYTMMLTEPCGKLVLEIGKPKPIPKEETDASL